MFSRFLLIVAFLTFSIVLNAQRLIAVQSGSSVEYFPQANFQAALDAAQEGDIVYLPGGTVGCDGDCIIDKPISLIGTGFFPDSTVATGSTHISSNFRLASNASGSYISGVSFDTSVGGDSESTLNSVQFDRCYFGSSVFSETGGYQMNSNSSDISFNACVFKSVLHMNNARNSNISNSILSWIFSQGRDTRIVNSAFLGSTTGGVIVSCSNCIVENSIFLDGTLNLSGGGSNSPMHVRNCVFVDGDPALNYATVSNILVGVPESELFMNNTNYTYDHTDDFHLVPGSPALTAGVGGTECGIYGGVHPWKPGAVPFNPHISEQVIAPTTNPQGGLPVQIKVAAQGQ